VAGAVGGVDRRALLGVGALALGGVALWRTVGRPGVPELAARRRGDLVYLEQDGGADLTRALDLAMAGDEPASPPVEEITGIGATYADRLEAAGIETVADLADSDVSTVVEAAQATESRVQDWLDQARNR